MATLIGALGWRDTHRGLSPSPAGGDQLLAGGGRATLAGQLEVDAAQDALGTHNADVEQRHLTQSCNLKARSQSTRNEYPSMGHGNEHVHRRTLLEKKRVLLQRHNLD